MGIFKTKGFARFARRENIQDAELCEAVARADRRLIDADLGGGVIKQRVARRGEGRSGGFRTVVLYRQRQRAVFVDGFAKSERDSINDDELQLFRELASEFLGFSAAQVERLVEFGSWIEVDCDGQEA